MRRFVCMLLCLFVITWHTSAQNQDKIAIKVVEVQTTVNVTDGIQGIGLIPDPKGDPIRLEKHNFYISDNGVLQTIESFREDDSPASIVIVFDDSRSMGWDIPNATDAQIPKNKKDDVNAKSGYALRALDIFFETLNPKDELALVLIKSRATLAHDFSSDFQSVRNSFLANHKGMTALADGIYMALQEIVDHARYTKRVIIVISDGDDNNSRWTSGDIKRYLRDSEALDVTIHTICIYDPDGPIGETMPRFPGDNGTGTILEIPGMPRSQPQSQLPPVMRPIPEPVVIPGYQFLDDIAKLTNGQSYVPQKRIESGPKKYEVVGKLLTQWLYRIALSIRRRYIISYIPSDQKDGRHKISYKLKNLPKELQKLNLVVQGKREYLIKDGEEMP